MSPNVILLDTAYVERVAAHFRQHFGAELGREIPQADLATLLVCIALDAEIKGEVQAILIHEGKTKAMTHIAPSRFAEDIDGKAFAEEGLGEFMMACCPVERITTLTELCAESLEALLDDKEVERIAVVYDFDGTTDDSRALTKRIVKACMKHVEACSNHTETCSKQGNACCEEENSCCKEENSCRKEDGSSATPKDITLFTMQPIADCAAPQQILGFSLLAALGIRGEEV